MSCTRARHGQSATKGRISSSTELDSKHTIYGKARVRDINNSRVTEPSISHVVEIFRPKYLRIASASIVGYIGYGSIVNR